MIIELDVDRDHHLLIHSSILSKASIQFDVGFEDRWSQGVPTIVHPTSGENLKIFTYRLVYRPADKVFFLDKQIRERGRSVHKSPANTYRTLFKNSALRTTVTAPHQCSIDRRMPTVTYHVSRTPDTGRLPMQRKAAALSIGPCSRCSTRPIRTLANSRMTT